MAFKLKITKDNIGNKEEFFMKEALKEAKLAKKRGDLPFGAVVVKNETIISKGQCREFSEKDVTAHAELEAVKKANKKLNKMNLSNCNIYATVEPCNMCASAIFQAKIPRIIIGASRDELSWVFRPRKIRINKLAKDQSYKPEIIFGLLKKEIKGLFKDIKLQG